VNVELSHSRALAIVTPYFETVRASPQGPESPFSFMGRLSFHELIYHKTHISEFHVPPASCSPKREIRQRGLEKRARMGSFQEALEHVLMIYWRCLAMAWTGIAVPVTIWARRRRSSGEQV
jgi:hypothetical protein